MILKQASGGEGRGLVLGASEGLVLGVSEEDLFSRERFE
jgi:hypothetical protein